MIADKECYERGCACYDDRVDSGGIKVIAKREWVGLTDEEISELIRATHNTGSFVRAIEAKLKEKNSDHRN